MTDRLLALDAGQTATKVSILDAVAPDVPLRQLRLDGVKTHRPLIPQLRDRLRAACEAAGETLAQDTGEGTPVRVAAIGSTGLTAQDHDAAALLAGEDVPLPRTVHLAHDSVTSALGALGDATGAVVAAGTGAVTLGIGRDLVARVDGWGNIMGDAGSAFAIGQSALTAVMRAHDGRGPTTALTSVVCDRFGDLEGIYIRLQNDPDRVAQVAALAPDVSELATSAHPDAVAVGICRQAAAELADSAATALRRVGEGGVGEEAGSTAVTTVGGVFSSAPILEEFRRLLTETVDGVEFRPVRGEGVDGAALMLGLPEEHPLRRMISTAHREVAI